jgi:hypothetical protein
MPFSFGSYLVSDADALEAVLAFHEACLANYSGLRGPGWGSPRGRRVPRRGWGPRDLV